jgi:hypothetical protein
MKKLVMLLVVLALCMPSYGYILVYKVTMNGTEVRRETTDDTEGWLLQKTSGPGYLVLDVNDEDPNVLNDVKFVDYYTETEDHTKYRLYEIWTTYDEEFTHSILPGLPPKGKNIVNMGLSLTSGRGFELGGVALGTVKSADIGTGSKVDVAMVLKGVCEWGYYEDDTLEDTGYGMLTLTLDTKWTKTANNPDETKGFGGDIGLFLDPESGPPEMPQGLINWLESKGYEPAD